VKDRANIPRDFAVWFAAIGAKRGAPPAVLAAAGNRANEISFEPDQIDLNGQLQWADDAELD
jgi:hypothetical protein